MEVHLFGAAHAVLDGETEIRFRPTMRDRALCHLAYADGWVSREALAFLFWPDVPEDVARHNVRQLLKRMRRLPWLESLEVSADVLRWTVPTDVDAMALAIDDERWDELPADPELLRGMDGGAEVEFEAWLSDERRRVRERWRTALLRAAAADAAAGEPGRAAGRLRPLVEEDDPGEVLPTYMELLVRSGDRPAALAAYDRVRARLTADLGIDPPARAADLATRLRHSEPDRPDRVSTRATGRRDELTEVLGVLRQPRCRLLTLLGPGGIGKSTLARLVLPIVGDRHADGAALVSLESTSDAGVVPARIAAAVGIRLDARLDPGEELVDRISDADLLLVVDNVEHLPESWTLLSGLVAACPRLRVLVTSRERLRLDEEWVYEVAGLRDADATELLRDRLRRVAPGVSVAPEEAVGICRAVGGSPLGIELAAPWLRLMGADQVVAEIERDVSILSGGPRDHADRHRSLTATMEHSWSLLSAEERAAVEALSVLVSPYPADLAKEVTGVSQSVLRDLADKSLLGNRSADRYFSHPLVRGYATARLAADRERDDRIRRRHAEVVLGTLARRPDAADVADLVDDAVAAWRWAAKASRLDLVEQAAEGLTRVLEVEGRVNQGLGVLAEAAAAATRADAAGSVVATIRRGEAVMLDLLGRHADAAAAARAAVQEAERAGADRTLAHALLALAWAVKTLEGDQAQYAISRRAMHVAERTGDPVLVVSARNSLGCSAPSLPECADHLQQGLDLAASERLGEHVERLTGNLGAVRACMGEAEAGQRLMREGLARARTAGRTARVAEYLSDLAFFWAEQGELGEAARLVEEAEDLAGTVESWDRWIYIALVAGEVRRQLGDWGGASRRLHTAMRRALDVGNTALMLRSLRLHGQLLLDQGDAVAGLRALAVVSSGPTRRGDFTSEVVNPRVWEDCTSGVPLDEVRAAQKWAEDHTVEQAVRMALGPCDNAPGAEPIHRGGLLE